MFRLARGLSLSPFRREWLVKDVVAGIVLTTLLVPQGMAYAELAGLPPGIVVILVLQRWLPKVPAVLITVVLAIAATSLFSLDETLNARRISLVFAELKDPVRGKIERYGLTRTIDPDHFFPTVEAAVTAFRARTGADWTPAVQPEADPTTADPTART